MPTPKKPKVELTTYGAFAKGHLSFGQFMDEVVKAALAEGIEKPFERPFHTRMTEDVKDGKRKHFDATVVKFRR